MNPCIFCYEWFIKVVIHSYGLLTQMYLSFYADWDIHHCVRGTAILSRNDTIISTEINESCIWADARTLYQLIMLNWRILCFISDATVQQSNNLINRCTIYASLLNTLKQEIFWPTELNYMIKYFTVDLDKNRVSQFPNIAFIRI